MICLWYMGIEIFYVFMIFIFLHRCLCIIIHLVNTLPQQPSSTGQLPQSSTMHNGVHNYHRLHNKQVFASVPWFFIYILLVLFMDELISACSVNEGHEVNVYVGQGHYHSCLHVLVLTPNQSLDHICLWKQNSDSLTSSSQTLLWESLVLELGWLSLVTPPKYF